MSANLNALAIEAANILQKCGKCEKSLNAAERTSIVLFAVSKECAVSYTLINKIIENF